MADRFAIEYDRGNAAWIVEDGRIVIWLIPWVSRNEENIHRIVDLLNAGYKEGSHPDGAILNIVEQAFIDAKAPHDYPLILEIARRIAK